MFNDAVLIGTKSSAMIFFLCLCLGTGAVVLCTAAAAFHEQKKKKKNSKYNATMLQRMISLCISLCSSDVVFLCISRYLFFCDFVCFGHRRFCCGRSTYFIVCVKPFIRSNDNNAYTLASAATIRHRPIFFLSLMSCFCLSIYTFKAHAQFFFFSYLFNFNVNRTHRTHCLACEQCLRLTQHISIVFQSFPFQFTHFRWRRQWRRWR